MELSHLAVQLIVAIVCAGIANVLIPRQIPGKFLGLMLVGLIGVWLGEGIFRFLKSQPGLKYDFLHWGILGVPIIPSILGCTIVIYLVTSFLRWARYHG